MKDASTRYEGDEMRCDGMSLVFIALFPSSESIVADPEVIS